MIFHDRQNDGLTAAVASLKTYDVSPSRSERLRSRCHAVLRAPARRGARVGLLNRAGFRRIIGPALGGAWCLAYLAEIIRRAAAVYGF